VHSLVLMGSKFFVGFMYDRKGLRTCLLICQITALVVLAALALVSPTPFGMTMWVIYAIFSSLALPLETIGVSLVVGDVFGNK
jgi:MFS family permease